MFGVFSASSKVLTGPCPFVFLCSRSHSGSKERIASSAFEIVTRINKDHFNAIVQYGAFADLTVCITEFCKVSKYQKISLLAIAMLRGVIPVMLQSPACSLSTDNVGTDQPMDDAMIKFWFPVLFGFYDIIMNGEDLEVRRLCVECFLCLPLSKPEFFFYLEPLILSSLPSKPMDHLTLWSSGTLFARRFSSQYSPF